MKKKKDLEETLKEKVAGLLEKTMSKSWGITIPQVESDISDKLRNPQLNVYIPSDTTFNDAKNQFKAQFLKSELKLHKGNISQLAKFLGLDRRSIHRAIKDLEINLDGLRGDSNDNYKDLVDQTIRSTLDEYKEIIQPGKMEKFYEEVPTLSRNIAKILPRNHLTWKEAEKVFEKQFILRSLKENKWNFTRTAEKMGIRVETLHRKVKKLELRK